MSTLQLDRDTGPAEAECLDLYRRLAAGVAVVTAAGQDGLVGMTASSVTSVSLRPPLLLVSLAAASRTLRAVRAGPAFTVHLLRSDQRELAARFAAPGAPRTADLRPDPVVGAPVLADVLAWSVCRLEAEHRHGDHSLVVGRVVASDAGAGRPLLWHDRCFRELSS